MIGLLLCDLKEISQMTCRNCQIEAKRFASAFAAQLGAWERLQRRAARGSREKFLAVLDAVPDTEPEEQDRL
jgi:hypothetical protein